MLVCAAIVLVAALPSPAVARPPLAECRRPRSTARPAVIERVVLIGLEPRFVCALMTALDPWGLELIQSDERSPGSSMPSTSLSARVIAEAHGARAVIWLDRDPAGFALWVYDAYNDRSVSRAAPSPPFSSSVSASLALSVKTTLMLVGLASEAPEQAPEPLATEKSAAIDAPSASIAALELTPQPEAPRPPPRWQLGAHGGVQLGPLEGGARDARYGLELRWFPASPEVWGLWPWLALELDAGLPLRVREQELDGRVWDAAPALGFGALLPLGDRFALGLAGAAALHVTSLAGTASLAGEHVDDLQANPTLRLGAELRANLGRLALGLEPSVELWLRAQRYNVDGVTVLEHRRRAFGLALAVWIPLN